MRNFLKVAFFRAAATQFPSGVPLCGGSAAADVTAPVAPAIDSFTFTLSPGCAPCLPPHAFAASFTGDTPALISAVPRVSGRLGSVGAGVGLGELEGLLDPPPLHFGSLGSRIQSTSRLSFDGVGLAGVGVAGLLVGVLGLLVGVPGFGLVLGAFGLVGSAFESSSPSTGSPSVSAAPALASSSLGSSSFASLSLSSFAAFASASSSSLS